VARTIRVVGQVSFLGTPLTLVGEPPRAGDPAPDFTLHRFSPDEGIVAVTLADLPPKPRLLSVVPSLDTPVCSVQTTTFEERLAALGDAIAAYTISLDLPFAQARFCGTEGVTRMQTLSDYQTRSFGTGWGLLIDELKLLARAVFVLDRDGTITHAQLVPEISHEPDYAPALAALEDALPMPA
jgi:thioredoxin-dependent peroxiredoxin